MTCANYKHHDGHVSSDLRSLVGHRRRLRRSGRCDSPDEENRLAEGRVVALDPATGAQKALWVTVPGPDNMGGVWGWGGVSVEPDASAV